MEFIIRKNNNECYSCDAFIVMYDGDDLVSKIYCTTDSLRDYAEHGNRNMELSGFLCIDYDERCTDNAPLIWTGWQFGDEHDCTELRNKIILFLYDIAVAREE